MRPALALGLVLAAVALVFAQVVGFGFVSWDDGIHLLDNPLVQAPSSASLRDHLLTPGLGYPTTLPVLSYRLEHALVGDAPWLYHLTNLGLHVLVCALVFRLATRFGRTTAGASFAALVFGLHPVVAETVSWVSGRKDLMVAALSLAAIDVATERAELGPRRRGAVVALFGLALACKPVAAYLLVSIPLLRWAIHRGPLRDEALRTAPMAAMLALYLPLAVAGQQAVHAVTTPPGVASYLRAIHWSLGMHCDLLFLIQEPSAKYLPADPTLPFTARVDLAPWLLAGTLALLVRVAAPRERRIVLALVGTAAAAYAPNSNLVPLTRFVADTYVYLPLAPLSIALGTGFDAFLAQVGARATFYRRALPAVVALALALLAVPAAARYRDSVSLWSQAMRVNPHEMRICRNWSEAIRTDVGAREGLAATGRCVARFGPDGFHKNRGLALVALGRYAEGLAELEAAARANPPDRELEAAIAEMRAHGIVPAR